MGKKKEPVEVFFRKVVTGKLALEDKSKDF